MPKKIFWVVEIKQRNGIWAPTNDGSMYKSEAKWKLEKYMGPDAPLRSYRLSPYIRMEDNND